VNECKPLGRGGAAKRENDYEEEEDEEEEETAEVGTSVRRCRLPLSYQAHVESARNSALETKI